MKKVRVRLKHLQVMEGFNDNQSEICKLHFLLQSKHKMAISKVLMN
jgi:hypothetical protein